MESWQYEIDRSIQTPLVKGYLCKCKKGAIAFAFDEKNGFSQLPVESCLSCKKYNKAISKKNIDKLLLECSLALAKK
ncbi:MAG TPA: hypothetical protein PK875_11210 [Spirochaetota bacterium]|nr:hypothetical protein [Spirochaetota bacterium]HPO46349.1 hypothetical protein [Spirochaetota bacterium]